MKLLKSQNGAFKDVITELTENLKNNNISTIEKSPSLDKLIKSFNQQENQSTKIQPDRLLIQRNEQVKTQQLI